ncbi:MCE family protein [Haloechinothrix sp. YIM 98757]|uniref:MCE family protein n=1 Tax=Haloechinothrix aidingensis TaxID=2752311 RepID=A0A838ADS5_9PSEU|nr:MCE family protein [Haloechinothrix aidingensis]MBA0127337.1 MCE family protein [Haloechinothrix aidingensis]
MTAKPARALSLLAVAVLVAAGLFLVVRPEPSMTVHADFAQADGLFVGSDVAVLGVPVGRVVEIEPRGDRVRLTMSLPADTDVPAGAEAWVASPTVVPDQYIELTPAYTGGEKMADGAVIPTERTRSPIAWDTLVESVNDLLVALGPDGAGKDGSLGRMIDSAAGLLDGRGEKLREAILNISQASQVALDGTPDAEALLESVDALMEILVENQSTVDSLTRSVNDVAGEFARQEREVEQALTSLTSVLREVAELTGKHGDSIADSVERLADVSVHLGEQQAELTELMDTLPLAADNITRAVTDEQKLRIRLDITTNLSQFDRLRPLCAELPLPLCDGPGIVNPIPLPPELARGWTEGE